MAKELNQEERFAKKIKLRFVLSFVIIAFGILAVCFSLYLQSTDSVSSTISGFYTGGGGGLIGAGIATAIKSWGLLKDDKKRKEKELEEYDERNLFLRARSMTYSGYVMIGVLYVGSLTMALVNETVSMTLLTLTGIYLVLIFIINTVLRKMG